MNNYCVYKHTSPSGKVYIGITSMNPLKRWKNGKGYELCTAFNRAIQKYGWDNIKHEILFSGLSKKAACQKEQELIKRYASTDPEYGYNLTSGGEHYEPNAEWCKRLSASNKQYYKDHPEARKRISESQRGRKLPEERKQKIKNSMKQFFIDHPEQRYERGNSFRGKKRGEAFSKALGERKSKRIVCNETGEIFPSLTCASEKIGTSRTGITNQLHGRSKTCKGYTFSFI